MVEVFEYKDCSWQEAVEALWTETGDNLTTHEYLSQFQMSPSWFTRPELATSIHGIAHMTRVLVYVNLEVNLFTDEQVLDYERNALSLSAVTHDTQRIIHDATDPQHGKRAADWVWKRYWEDTLPFVKADRMQSYLLTSYTAYINEHHDPDDREDTMSFLLALFKDADALDRFRDPQVGDFNLNPKYLRFSHSRLLIPIASELVRRSEAIIKKDGNPFNNVLEAAAEMRLIV
jgi:hypothetical protein